MSEALQLSALSAAAGCTSEVPASNDDEAVTELVRALGFETESIELDGNVIRVDGDMILYRDKLLNGEYEPVQALSQDLFDKGYRHTSIVTTDVFDMKLIWGTGSEEPTTTIKNAFINAAGDYNSITDSALYLSQNNFGATIRVRMVAAASWASSPCVSTDVACAEFPSGGNPGANIYIKDSGLTANCANWTTSALDNRTRHELGHAFGFRHPKDGSGSHISGTEVCTGTTATCSDNPGYSTVMKKTGSPNT